MLEQDAMQWKDALEIIERLHNLMQAIEVEERSVVAVKCPTCNEMISAYGFSEHTCN